jgi:hypothetical protein
VLIARLSGLIPTQGASLVVVEWDRLFVEPGPLGGLLGAVEDSLRVSHGDVDHLTSIPVSSFFTTSL